MPWRLGYTRSGKRNCAHTSARVKLLGSFVRKFTRVVRTLSAAVNVPASSGVSFGTHTGYNDEKAADIIAQVQKWAKQ